MATVNKNKTLSYSRATDYENKLDRVMKRLDVEKFTFNYDRQGNSYVEFWYKGSMYRFEHSIEKAAKHGITLKKGSDAFAQIVLSLEDLARMVERGIYDLQIWVKGMVMLPEAKAIPSFLKFLGFSEIPQTVDEIKAKYREQSKLMHPDAGGNIEDFNKLSDAYKKALAYVGGEK